MPDSDRLALRTILDELFDTPFGRELDDDAFNDIALRVFAFQFARNAPYAAYCERRGRTPVSVTHWTGIPAVPTAAFKEVALVAGTAADAEAVFRTSGTTRGAERRGTHYIPDVSLYHASLRPAFAACLLPDGPVMQMLSLMPASTELPDSSLAHMIDVVMAAFGDARSAHVATAAGGIDHDALMLHLHDADARGAPVCLLGTSLSFIHWLDHLAARGTQFRLPDGSRLMDTGGYKGRSREVAEDALREQYGERLGIHASHCVNEYGMTELCSQFYDSTLRDAVQHRTRERHKLAPPWVRTRIVDPETLEPVPAGSSGLLQHMDLANAGSVMAVQTEDVGIAVEDGFRLLGRVAGAMPRGCSIAMDLLLEVAAGRRG